MRMTYAGQNFDISPSQLTNVRDAAATETAHWTKVRLLHNDRWGLFLLGGGVPVAITDLAESDLPEDVSSSGNVYVR